MALRAEHRDFVLGPSPVRGPPDAFWWTGDPSVGNGPEQDMPSGFLVHGTANSELERTRGIRLFN